jgi:hypothetical protein
MFENGSRTSAMAQAKFASLDAAYASFRAHEGTAKPSLPDYLALTSGQYSGKGTFGGSPSGIDVGTIGFAGSQANIMAQLATAGFSWKAYEEGVSVDGYNHWGTANDANYPSSLYLSRHCPAAFYTTTSSAGVSHGNGRYDFDELATDIANSTLPDFFFVTPNGNHDGHDNGFAPANTWLNSGGSWGRASPTPPTRRRAPTSHSSKRSNPSSASRTSRSASTRTTPRRPRSPSHPQAAVEVEVVVGQARRRSSPSRTTTRPLAS